MNTVTEPKLQELLAEMKTKKERDALSTLKAKWFGFGLLCAGLLIGGYSFFLQSLFDTTTANAKAIAVQRDACQAKFERATVLYDFQPTQGLQVGPVALQPQTNGQLVGDDRPRWFVPVDVNPTVYGAPQGAVYYHIDLKTQRQEGPFTPEVSH